MAKKLKTAQELCDDPNTSHRGFLRKYNPVGKVQNRYCIINNGIFYYYKEPESTKPQGCFSLAGYLGDVGTNQLQFQIKHQTDENKRTYTFKAPSKLERDVWVRQIKESVLKVFPVSLYKEDEGPSEDYDYIARDDLVKSLPHEYGSVRKEIISSAYVGPKYNVSQTAPKYIPDLPVTPDIPERVIPVGNTIRSSSYDQEDPEVEGDYVEPILKPVQKRQSALEPIQKRQSDYIEEILKRRSDYVEGDGTKVAHTAKPTNTMTDNYVSMVAGEKNIKNVLSECYEAMSDIVKGQEECEEYEDPYLLVVSDYDDDDDEGAYEDIPGEQDKEAVSRSLPNALPANLLSELNYKLPSHPTSSYQSDGDDKKMDNTIKEVKSLTLGSHQAPSHPKVERVLTAPPKASGEDVSPHRVPHVPPRPSKKEKVPIPNVENLTDQMVMPKSCLHANVQRDQCVELLFAFDVGTYLIRTAREDGKDAIAVLARKNTPKVRHFIVFENDKGEKYLAKEEPTFKFLPNLIKHYYHHYLPQTELKLICPTTYAVVEDRW